MVNNQKQKDHPIKYPTELLIPIRDFLSKKLSGLEKTKKDLAEEDPFNDTERLNDNAAMDADAAERVGHMEASALKQTVDRSIIQIRKALSRIKFGNYGVCEKCHKMIDTDRLMVMPETTICLECEKRKEK
jgi:RNA polymerase-binding transcription factor DksA